MKRALLALLALAGCTGEAPTRAARWTPRDYLARHDADVDFGGFLPRELAVTEGEALRFQPGTQASGLGLTIFPGLSGGVSAPFVITDVWQNHPTPWVQPVWSPRDENGGRIPGALNLFPVGLASTFYSPYWAMEELRSASLTADSLRTARDVLDSRLTPHAGPLVLCPIIEGEVNVARGADGRRDPLTGAALAAFDVNHAWVEGTEVSYLGIGPDRFESAGQLPLEARAYFFVTADGERPLPVAVVLPDDALRHALVRRVDVVLAGAAPYVPPDRPELRAALEARGYDAPPAVPDAGLPLRVAANPGCFSPDGGDVTTCQWLDEAATLAQLPQGRRLEREVQLTLGVLGAVP